MWTERILTLRKVFAKPGYALNVILLPRSLFRTRIERRRSEPWNHWGHYRHPGHYHFGDRDPAIDLAQPGREAVSLRKFELVRVLPGA